MSARSSVVARLAPLAVGALLVSAAPALAQGGDKPLKIAVLDVQKILTDSALGKEALAKLKQLQDQKIGEAKAKQDEINTLRAKANESRMSLTEDKLAELEKQVQDKVNAFRRFQEDADTDFQRNRDETFEAIEKKVMPIITQIGAEGGYTLIFNKFQSGLVYADDKMEITAQVIQRFDAMRPAKGK